MNLPIETKTKIEALGSSYNTKELTDTSLKMSETYLKENSNGESLVFSPIQVFTYAVTRMPATYASISSALNDSFELVEKDINSILDLGSGTGSMALVANELLPNVSITCVEREIEMLNLASKIIDTPTYINEDAVKNFPDNKADLVSACYFINEIKENELDNILSNIWEASKKYILIVEPGTVKSYKRIMKVKDYYIAKGGYIVSPCPHMNKCPLKDDWCHFSTRVSRSKLHKELKGGDAPYEDEKYTYLFISKTKLKPDYSRVLRHPIINSGFILLRLCNVDGSVNDIKITKSNKDKYKLAKKLSSGDRF